MKSSPLSLWVLGIGLLVLANVAIVCAQTAQGLNANPKQLKKAAYSSLWRLKRAIERDGYYSARVALNVWRSNAIDAGIFDPNQYEEFKRQIYTKSIQSNLNCFEQALVEGNTHDAEICLHMWKIHSEEINSFDPKRYEEMKLRIP
jgi:hypothetical protein